MSSRRKYIEVIARGVCVKGGKLLVCHTKGASNTYLPGGHVDFTESADTALAREISEEMGLKARVGTFLGGVEHTFTQKNERHCEINLVFMLNIQGLVSARAPDSMEDYIYFEWLDLKKIKNSSLEPASLRSLIPAWLKASHDIPRWGSNY